MKVSILIAAYNVENYIDDALGSALAQTLKDIEVIVVDDGSTDKTLSIVEKYAALDSRVKVVRHEVNRGLMAVRKTGFQHATGDYILFLDADDQLLPNSCEVAYKAITEEQVDILQFDAKLMPDDGTEINPDIERSVMDYLASEKHKIVSPSPCGLLDTKLVHGKINMTVWNKIYSRTVLESVYQNIPDEYVNIAEDVLFSYVTHYFAKTFSYVPKALYKYRFGSGMTTTAEISDKKIEALAKCAFVYSYLKNWTEKRGHQKLCKEALQRVKQQMMGNVSDTFFYKLGKEQKNRFLSLVEQYCGAGDAVLALYYHASAFPHVSVEDLVQDCASLELFSAPPRKVKTVGVHYYRMYNGGVENVLSSLTDLWVRSGYRVVLFTDEEPSEDDYEINPNVKRVTVPPAHDGTFSSMDERISTFREALIENEVDVMVYNAWVDPFMILDEMIVKSCGIRLIVHTHSLFCFNVSNADVTAAYHNAALGKVYSMADSVVALTDVDAAWWTALGFRAFRTVNPIKFSMDEKPSALSGHNVLFVARLSWEKQVIDALKIIRKVKKEIPDVKLTVVGKGDDSNYVRQIKNYIKEHKLEKNVDMAGFHTEVLPFYQSADVFLSTSKFEGFGLSLMESKLCGLPLVSYELPNLDITRENRGMITVAQSDIKAAADAIIKILKDDALKHRLGREARASAEAMYGMDFAAHWTQIFEETMASNGEKLPLYRREPLEIAVNVAVDFYARGILARGSSVGYPSAYAGDWSYYAEQCKVLSNAIRELGESESYRVGLFVTAIPRWIKRMILRLFKRGES